MKGIPWTAKEEAKFLKAISKCVTVQEAVAAAAAALPGRDMSRANVDAKLRRMGSPTLGEIVQANAHASVKGPEARIASYAKKGCTLEELCDRFSMSPKQARAALADLKAKGYALDVSGERVGYVPPAPVRGEQRIIAPAGEEQIFAVASDIHVGSKYFLRAQFVDFVHRAYNEGVRTIFVPGDILDGVYRHSRWEESHHGFHDQASYAAEVFPQLPGLQYVGIIGNHDETFEKESGMSVVHALVQVFKDAGRSDLTLLGARGAYVRFAPKGGRGILVELWHPLGGGSYAVSYKLQRHVEEYGVGQKPDFLFAGHWHQQVYVVRRGVHCFLSGTFHGGGSAFGKALGGSQAIGGWIVRFRQTADGTVREVQPTWCAYYETEQVRELALA